MDGGDSTRSRDEPQPRQPPRRRAVRRIRAVAVGLALLLPPAAVHVAACRQASFESWSDENIHAYVASWVAAGTRARAVSRASAIPRLASIWPFQVSSPEDAIVPAPRHEQTGLASPQGEP